MNVGDQHAKLLAFQCCHWGPWLYDECCLGSDAPGEASNRPTLHGLAEVGLFYVWTPLGSPEDE